MVDCKKCIHEKVCANYLSQLGYTLHKDINSTHCPFFLECSKVVVLPCKIGDTVYAFCETLNQILDYAVEDICISDDRLMFRAYFHRGYELVDVILFEENDIGKTVFLTKEEAERAIKDGKNNE